MGYIKEPKGVDFIIKSRPLTNEELAAISEFIAADKAKMSTGKAISLKKRVTMKTKRAK